MKLALISGGSRGLGAALCAAYQQAGFRVLEYSRSAPHAWSVRCDFSDPESVERVLLGSLDAFAAIPLQELVVISNAATLAPIGLAGTRTAAAVCDNLAINLSGAIVFMNTVLRVFGAQPCRKSLVNISSGAARKAYAGWSLYCAAKAGLEHFVRTVAAEQTGTAQPFRVFSLDPGVMDTAMQASIRHSPPDDFPAVERFIARHRAGELKAPAAVAARIVELIAGEIEAGTCGSATPTNG